MGCLLVTVTSQPRSSSCATRVQPTTNNPTLYYIKTEAFLCFYFAFLTQNYYLLFDKLWESEMDGPMDTLFSVSTPNDCEA